MRFGMLKVFWFLSLVTVFCSPTFAQSLEKKRPDNSVITFEVDLKLKNFTKEQEHKVLQAAELIKKVIISDQFKQGVLNHTYLGQRTFADNNGLTNEQIYQKIMEGSEELKPEIDYKMDLDLQVYFENTKTVGYTRPTVSRVWMNSKYLDKNGPAEVTTNMMHEWLHKLGFKHEMKHSRRRTNTVPYAIGYLMERLARRLYSTGTLEKL
jgi:hypothetical protein